MAATKMAPRKRRLKKRLTSEEMAQDILHDASRTAQTQPVKQAVLAGLKTK